MFDVFGLVTDTANDYLAPLAAELFPVGDHVVLSSEVGGASYKDIVRIGAGSVTLDNHVYSVIHLDDDALERRPVEFVTTYMAPAVRALGEGFRGIVDGMGVIGVRAPGSPGNGLIKANGYLKMNGIDIRWLIDYDATNLSNRLVTDFYLGTDLFLRIK